MVDKWIWKDIVSTFYIHNIQPLTVIERERVSGEVWRK